MRKAYITEEEFNEEVIRRGLDDPTQDSPDDSDEAVAIEVDIGVSGVAEDEPEQIEGETTDQDRLATEPGPRRQTVESSPRPSPREDENLDTSTH